MDWTQWGWPLILTLTALLLAWQMYQNKDRPTSLADLAQRAVDAERLARLGVQAAQQLYEQNELAAEHRYNYVDLFLRQTFPALEEDQRRMLIEGAVYGLKLARRQGLLPAPTAAVVEKSDTP